MGWTFDWHFSYIHFCCPHMWWKGLYSGSGYVTEWFSKFGVTCIDLDHARNLESSLIRQFRGSKSLIRPCIIQQVTASVSELAIHIIICCAFFPLLKRATGTVVSLSCLQYYFPSIDWGVTLLLMFGREVRPPVDYLLGRVLYRGSVNDWVQEHWPWVQLAVEGVRDRLKAAAEWWKRNHDQTFRCRPMI